MEDRMSIAEKSVEVDPLARAIRVTDLSPLELNLFRFAKWGLVGTLSALYLLAHAWNHLFGPLMVFLFAYSFAGLAHFLIDFVVYYFTTPVILPEKEEVLVEGIPSRVKVAFIRPIFARSVQEMQTLLDNMGRDVACNQGPHRNAKFVVIDNTRDTEVRQYVRKRIEELQNEFGEDLIFYFHRNAECDFFKKLGIYQDFVMFLREGWTRPRHYTDQKWAAWTKGTRDVDKPLWDEILGDVRVLGLATGVNDILAGKEVTVLQEERVEFAFICDADNVWPAGQAQKMTAKMLHPGNAQITIFQPTVELSNPNENGFIKLNAWARQMYGFDPVAKWRLYRFSPFYGKGAMRLSNYVEDIIKAEALHPGKAASHDFQESLKTPCVLLEDVFIYEKTFSNKLAELIRGAQWLWGDMETVSQFITQKFSPGQKEHLWMLLRVAIGNLLYGLWLVGTIISWSMGWVKHEVLLWAVFLSIAGLSIVVPKLLIPYLDQKRGRRLVDKPTDSAAADGCALTSVKGRPFGSPPALMPSQREGIRAGTAPDTPGLPGVSSAVKMAEILDRGFRESIFSTLIHYLDLVYRPRALIQNLIKQWTGKEFVWITGAMGEIQTTNASLASTYKALLGSTAVGAVLLVVSVSGLLGPGLAIFMAPYTASFLLGPLAIWITAKPTSLLGKN